MPLDTTSPGPDAFLLATAIELELTPRDRRVAIKRYAAIQDHLQKAEGPLAPFLEDAWIYPQGSMAIGTTIVDGATDDRYDLDAILEFDRPAGWTPRQILDEAERVFARFPDVQKVVRCTRCIQLQFAFMHLDVTPMDPDTAPRPDRVGTIYHSPDRDRDDLFSVNPYGFAEWFKSRIVFPTTVFQDTANAIRARVQKDRLPSMQIMADVNQDDLPDPVAPWRDAPQVVALKLLKRYLNLRYANRDEKRPISVYLSKIAAETPPSPFGLCAQLETLAGELYQRMQVAANTGLMPRECNPAHPRENFNDRWPKSASQARLFQADLVHLQKELARARVSDVGEIKAIFEKLFGERVTRRAIEDYAGQFGGEPAKSAFERGKGFVASPAIVAPTGAAAGISRAPAHNFHIGSYRGLVRPRGKG